MSKTCPWMEDYQHSFDVLFLCSGMSRIGEFTVPSESFLLADALEAVPEMVVELQEVVAHDQEKLVPFFWVHHGDKSTFDTAIRNDSTLEKVKLLDEFERGTSYRGVWTRNAEGVAYGYAEAGATILEATGQADSWTLRMRFDGQDALGKFQSFCRENGIAFTLEQLYNPSQPMAGGQFGLSDVQRERLVHAYQRGLFNVPRETTLGELAEEFGTTQQALSAQFRKAHSELIENTLIVKSSRARETYD